MYRVLRNQWVVNQNVKNIFQQPTRFYVRGRPHRLAVEDTITNEQEVSNDTGFKKSQEDSDISLKGTSTKDLSWVDKIVYSSFLESYLPSTGFKSRLRHKFEVKQALTEDLVNKSDVSLPISLKYYLESQKVSDENDQIESNKTENKGDERMVADEDTTVQFPYKIDGKTEFVDDDSSLTYLNESKEIKLESVRERMRKFEVDLDAVMENNEPSVSDRFESRVHENMVDIGTPNPNLPTSDVPCGGCGALLHCRDQAIPGYISSEKFSRASKKDLMAEICYRCCVLETHQATLNINVSPEDYPRIVGKIEEKFAMVLLMIDLTDFPCSIWPEILDVIGNRRPVFLVGNKVDLLPQDSPDFLKRIESSLVKSCVEVGLLEANIIHTSLISAKTGFGVENLISDLFGIWKGKGDIFIMGCTNVGKSSLFNLFLQSDLCKPQASDLVQRSTISQWPGTTLNLLKFPMTSPQGWRKALRFRRLKAENPAIQAEKKERLFKLRETGNPEYAVLQGHVGKTLLSPEQENAMNSSITVKDIFQVNATNKYPPSQRSLGQWNPNDPIFTDGHWVYDTPGAVSTNQILDLLTLPELMHSLPNEFIQPRSFYIKPNMSFFVGGIARIDFTEGDTPIRFTLFTNSLMPVTMSLIEDADELYKHGLGSKVFAVPSGNQQRIAQFPPLKSVDKQLTGTGHTLSCADVVLSSIGWISVTAGRNERIQLTIYTPDGKGIFIRQPAMLPYVVRNKGKRMRGTYSYLPHHLYMPKKLF